MKKISLFCLLALLSFPLAAAPAETGKITIQGANGSHDFTVEIARTPEAQRTGLMHRTSLAPDHGMLFLMPTDRRIRMWMKDTPLALDMLFIDSRGRIVYIAANATPNSETIISARRKARAVLELRGGTAAADGITTGDQVIAEYFTP